MAHGSKRWIKTYSGRLKKSRNRTKIDWLSDLNNYERVSIGRWKWNGGVKDTNCPQCRYVRKQVDNSSKTLYFKKMEELRERFMKQFHTTDTYIVNVRDKKEPWGFRTVFFYDWSKTQPDYPTPYWMHNWRNYFCFKCEKKEYISRIRYYKPYHGKKANYQSTIKHEYNRYRSKVRQLMKNARYDEELYDDIPTYKHGWLD